MQGAVARIGLRPVRLQQAESIVEPLEDAPRPSEGTRAAASSRASGIPSSRRQIWATIGVFAVDNSNASIGRGGSLREKRDGGALHGVRR